MRKLIIKYGIEFFVIVFGISVSFFVENYRESIEKDKQRVITIKSIINELEFNDDYYKLRAETITRNVNFVRLFVEDSLTLDVMKTYPQQYSPANPFMSATGFAPNQSIFNSLVNDGSLNLIKSSSLKAEIDNLYTTSYNSVITYIEEEKDIAVEAEKMFMKKYPNLYLKNIWFNYRDLDVLTEFVSAINDDSDFKALMLYKLSLMQAKSRQLNQYIVTKDSLLNELRNSLKSKLTAD